MTHTKYCPFKIWIKRGLFEKYTYAHGNVKKIPSYIIIKKDENGPVIYRCPFCYNVFDHEVDEK